MQGIPRMFRSEFYVLNTTGPGLITRTLVENPDFARQVKVLFPEDVCNDRTWHQFGNYGVHMMEGSWRGGSFLSRRLGNYWQARTMRKLMKESRALGKTRQLLPKGAAAEASTAEVLKAQALTSK